MRAGILFTLPLGAACLWGCGPGSEVGLRGQVILDGSSTVYPIAEAVSEEFQLRFPRVLVTASRSGTGGGLAKFCRGETDVSTASRLIQESEAALCAANGIDYVELPLALDGISVVVNPATTFLDCLTVEELRRIWQPSSAVRTWRDVRPEFPPAQIQLYGPGTDSGTFDFFTQVIVGQVGASRTDFQASEDDNVLVQGLIGDRYALGYFGYAYVAENPGVLKVLGVDGGGGCVRPSQETIRDRSYAPLSRRLFLYVKRRSLERAGMRTFMSYFMGHAAELIPPTGLVSLPDSVYAADLASLAEAAERPMTDSLPEGEGRGDGS